MAQKAGDFSTEIKMGITWKLRNFLPISANVCWSPESPSFSLSGSKWQLELYASSEIGEYIYIVLRRLNYSVALQTVKATFSLKNRDGVNCVSKSNDYSYGKDSYYLTPFIRRSQLEKMKYSLFADGTLTVHCQITVEPSSDDSGASDDVDIVASPRQHLDAFSQTETPGACKGDGDLKTTSSSVQNLQTDYKKLLESKEVADVCLKVSDKEFRAHKCILGARSSVFSAMFKHDMQENNSDEVVIEDLDPESFPDFLQHVYAGSVDKLSEENVFNLYTAADKYDMGDLKSECKSYMERTLSVDTFCDVMILALRYKEDELLKVAIDFFFKNVAKIIVTVKWQMFSKENNTEANELFIKLLVPADEK